MRVLILGGYGVFGGRLARLLLADGFEVVVAGRSETKARAFTQEHGGTPLALDSRNQAALRAALTQGDILVDAAGPFQRDTDHRIARIGIACGCHVLDLSDDARFTASITELDADAQAAGVMVLSGVSSVPAISSAAVEALRGDLSEITLIETAILPGNRAPRGRSVMAAILSQVGRPLKMWRGGAWRSVKAWGGQTKVTLPMGLSRSASVIGAPDLALFPDAYDARSVVFRAGLELGIMHHSLRLLGWLHGKGLLPRLDRLTTPLIWAAKALERFGSDEGGMAVRVAGRDAAGRPVTRGWRLHIGEGQGPFIPAVPALLMARRIRDGGALSGARPALGCFPLHEAEAALAELGAVFDGNAPDATPLFEHVLGPDKWASMPASFRTPHDLWDYQTLSGQARVRRGSSLLARLIAAVFRFPPERAETPVTVTMERVGQTEVWTRDFDGRKFRSVLSRADDGAIDGAVRERFGIFTFEMSLPVKEGRMEMPVRAGWCLGVPLPRALLPGSETAEYDDTGRFHFDVKISAPLAGMIVHYQGWLLPDVEKA